MLLQLNSLVAFLELEKKDKARKKSTSHYVKTIVKNNLAIKSSF